MGILTVAGSALSSGVGTAGSVLASTAKVVGGLKTLALLGIGTSELNFCSVMTNHLLIHRIKFSLNVQDIRGQNVFFFNLPLTESIMQVKFDFMQFKFDLKVVLKS